MNFIYSKTSEYAIRSLAYLASRTWPSYANAAEVSKNTQVPQAYVAKIFQCLVGCGILKSHRGPSGGFYLAVDPSKLSLLQVIEAVDDPSVSAFSGCVMGLEKCSDHLPCPLHQSWLEAKEKIIKDLSKNTVLDIVKLEGQFKRVRKRRYTLSRRMRKIFKST